MFKVLNDNEIIKYQGEPVKGFYIWFGGLDHFIITNRQRVTNKFVIDWLGCNPPDIRFF